MSPFWLVDQQHSSEAKVSTFPRFVTDGALLLRRVRIFERRTLPWRVTGKA
jgi:hypothetical protein